LEEVAMDFSKSWKRNRSISQGLENMRWSTGYAQAVLAEWLGDGTGFRV